MVLSFNFNQNFSLIIQFLMSVISTGRAEVCSFIFTRLIFFKESRW